MPNLSDIVNAVSKGEESRLQSTKHTQSQSRRCAKGGKMKKKKCAGERGMWVKKGRPMGDDMVPRLTNDGMLEPRSVNTGEWIVKEVHNSALGAEQLRTVRWSRQIF